uniref:Uncharacterized protein n=1 Tax=Branchiostoma floridae TaxID=7739 RepID=C3Z2B4_BRAFL|eukprot:XP_002597153.1 hypothetical protein BRAFLDRAFT_118100 [Branchiostoma floridae]
MWDFLITLSSCFCTCSSKSNKVSPVEDGDVKEERAPAEEEMVRGTTECSVVTSQPPMSQPRSSKSSADVLAELRQDGLLPLNTRGESVAFQVLLDKPASEPDAPPRRPVKLAKLEETLQERRERVKKEPAGSRTQLRQQLSNAANRREEMLAERSRRLAERRARINAKAAAKERKSTAFVISSVSDTDAIVPRDSEKAQALEKRLNKRRERVAKRTTAEDMAKQQALAAERRKEKDIREFVEKISRKFDLVMVLEYFDESLVLLRRLLCWDMRDILNFKYNSFQYGKLGNTSFSENLVQNYRQHSAIDYTLYEHFNNTLWRKINKAGSDFREELAHFRRLQTTMKTECSRKFDDFSPVYIAKTAWNAEFYIDSTFCTWMKIFQRCYLTLLQDRNHRHRDKSLRIQRYRQPSESCGLYCKPYCILCTEIKKQCTHHEYVTHLYQEDLLVPDQSSSAKLTRRVPHHGGRPEPIS